MVKAKSKVLIVDDNPVNLKLMAKNLSVVNYEVLLANSAQQGFLIASKKKPDIIISDIMMPETDGFQFFRILKNNEDTKDIPFIFVSALNDVSVLYKELAECDADFVAKPVNYVELVDKINFNLNCEEYNATLLKKSLLIVDDNTTNRLLLREFLSSDFKIEEAQNADEAIDLVLKHHFDFILLDIEMPVNDGWFVLREFKRLKIDSPVFAITAHDSSDIMEKALCEGFTFVFNKPFDYGQIRKLMSDWKTVHAANSVINVENPGDDCVENIFDFSLLLSFTDKNSDIFSQVIVDYQTIVQDLIRILDSVIFDQESITELEILLHKLSNVSAYVNSKKVVKDIRNFEMYIRKNRVYQKELITEFIEKLVVLSEKICALN